MQIEIRDGYALDAGLVVDEEACVVKGIKILGNISHNGYAYPRDARVRSHEVLAKAKCNWNHAKEVPLENRFGWFSNVREDPNADCTRADLHYLKDHEHAKHFVNMAHQSGPVGSRSMVSRRGPARSTRKAARS